MKANGTRLKFVCRLGYGDALTPDAIPAGEISVFGSNGVYSNTTSSNTGAPAIIVGRKGSYGKINWSDSCCFASDTTFFIDDNLSSHNLRWLYWVLQTLGLDEGSNETAVPGVNRETVYEKRVLVPTVADQRRIADYLDAETTQIDALLAEKERMLALLAEKRTALVSRAVTCGLDPDTPMKPSGLEWLGDIPAHWEVLQLKFVCSSLQTGPFGSQLHAEDYVDAGTPVINPAHLKDNVIVADSRVTVDEDTVQRLSVHRLFPGDVVFARRGELGRCGVVSPTEEGWLCGTGSLRARPIASRVSSEFLAYIFTGTHASEWLTTESVGSTMDNLNTEMLGHFKIHLPPLDEQKMIVSVIMQDCARTAELEANLNRSLSLLTERRSALITAAVTGQIDPEAMTV